MSLLDDFRTKEIRDFPGQRSALPAASLPAEQGARKVENIEFFDGYVQTRRGFGTAFSATPSPNRVDHMRQWLMPTWSRLMMLIPHASAPKVRYRDLVGGLEADVVTGLASTVTTADFQEYGSRMFMAFVGDDGLGKARPRVWNGLSDGSGPMVDLAFLAPPAQGSAFSASYSEPGSGSIDAGDHKVGLLFETRNGFTVKAVELNTTFTATGALSLQVQLSPVGSWASSWRYVSLLLTTVQNPERFWIVPNSRTAIPFGTGSAVNLTANISDTTLAALDSTTSEATDHFATYAYGDSSFSLDAKAIVSYSGRMCYVVDEFDAVSLGDVSRLMISEPGDPQRLSLDQHEVRLPGNLPITTAAPLGNQLYIIGPTTIHAVVDNLDKPATWGEPQLVDGRIGTPCVHGIGKDPSRNVLFIANPRGLFAFDGATVPDKPLSYYQDDEWKRINWAAPKGSLKVVVDGAASTVHVIAPLDDETVPTQVMSWNYRNGHSYQRVDFSMMRFQASELNTLGGAAIVVRDSLPELWLANRTTANEVQRQKSLEVGDANIYRDGAGSGYFTRYRTGQLPRMEAFPQNHYGFHVELEGLGPVAMTAYTPEGRNKALNPVTLVGDTKGLFLRRAGVKSEGMEIEFVGGGSDGNWMKLSFLKVYYDKWLSER